MPIKATYQPVSQYAHPTRLGSAGEPHTCLHVFASYEIVSRRETMLGTSGGGAFYVRARADRVSEPSGTAGRSGRVH